MIPLITTFLNQTVDLGSTEVLVFDLVAIAVFVGGWVGFSKYADHQYSSRANLMSVMNGMRWRWMKQMLKRSNRMVDSTLMGNLLRSISFFANTSIFILIGLISMIGYRDSAIDMLSTIPFAAPSTPFVWEIKLFNLVVIFVYAFFKFTWSLRQYNYCCVLVGGAPFHDEHPEGHDAYAEKSGSLLANAASHFNMGLRAYYFGLAAISWFIHPVIFIVLTVWVIFIIYRREFKSRSLLNLQGMDEGY